MGEPAAPSVVVVGAGVAGLIAARDLTKAGARVTVVDKGRGVGGRLATRRIGDAVLDHGAQFLTARSTSFASEVARWAHAGVVAPWFTGVLGGDGVVDDDGEVRYRGVPAMTGIAKMLAIGLDVHLSARVAALRPFERGWRVDLERGDHFEADALVVTAPAPQTARMLDRGTTDPIDRARLEQIAYEPCLAVLAVLDRSPGIGSPGARRPSTEPVAWYADNHAKGVSTVPALTVHAGPHTSRELWLAADADVVAELVLPLDLDGAVVRAAQVQRWRHARPTSSCAEPCLMLRSAAPAAVAGDGFGTGGRVEGAALSGMAAAASIAECLGLDPQRRSATAG